MRVSFILPCYNVEPYLEDCLDSIYNQGLAESEFEVICINDCSTDRTRALILSRQSSCTNLILLDQPRNMFPGAARNRGLEVARGQYIWFVDSDDWLKPNALGIVLKKMQEDDLDFLFFNYDDYRDGDYPDQYKKAVVFGDWGIQTGLDFLETHFDYNLNRLSLVWTCLFSRRFIQEHHIVFPDLIMSEDSLFLWQCIFEAIRVESLSGSYYVHRIQGLSIVLSPPNARKMYNCSFLFPKALRTLSVQYKDRLPKVLHERIEGYIRHELNLFAVRYLRLNDREKHLYYQSMQSDRQGFKAFLLSLSKKNLLVYWASFLGERFFQTVARSIANYG